MVKFWGGPVRRDQQKLYAWTPEQARDLQALTKLLQAQEQKQK